MTDLEKENHSSIHGLDCKYCTGAFITEQIMADPEEVERLRHSRRQAREGQRYRYVSGT